MAMNGATELSPAARRLAALDELHF
ncbi:MAG: hypothetical protein CFH38_01509, partial [Alphaproteobacteria bacterium MarineAlpha10_Bin1]